MNIDCCKSYVGKQVIGLLPDGGGDEPLVCLFSTAVLDQTCSGFSDPSWDFNGFGNNPSSYAASVGGYVVQDGAYGFCFPFFSDTASFLNFYFIGTSAPPDFSVYDPFFATTVFYPYSVSACSFGCLTTGSVRWNNSPYIWADFGFLAISANLQNYSGNIDFNLGPLAVEDILTLILSKYQPQATVNVTDDGSGFFTITFNDLYYIPTVLNNGFGLWYDSGNSIDSVSMTPC